WISWSPFVGMFIARISKGRTVREFVLGVILIPTLLSFVWMSVFGGAALSLQSHGMSDILSAVKEDVATALFVMLQHFPFSQLLSFIAIMLVTVFFVTSSDSGSLVVDHLTSGGKLDSPTPQRVFWALMEGVVAAVLLIGGGLTTLQTASVCTGLPFAVILLVAVYSLYIGFSEELFVENAVKRAVRRAVADHRTAGAVSTAIEREIGD
ncbi:MAG: BCCT family transporter, partial [Thermodesulfobacteriota bacterium]